MNVYTHNRKSGRSEIHMSVPAESIIRSSRVFTVIIERQTDDIENLEAHRKSERSTTIAHASRER